MSQQLSRDPRGQYHQQRENHPKIKPGLTSNSNGLSVLITTLGIGIILVSYIFCGAFIFSSLEGHSGKKKEFLFELASSGPYGPLLARSGYVGEDALVLQKHSL